MGADVDAAGRLVEDQEARLGGEPARQQRLLLVAAGQELDRLVGVRSADVERLDEFVGDRPAFGGAERLQPAAPGLQRQNDVLTHAEVADDTVGLAILGTEAEAERNRLARRGDTLGGAIDGRGAAVGLVDAEQQLRGLGAAGAEQAGDADHFAGADVEIEGRHGGAPAVAAQGHEALAGRAAAAVPADGLVFELAAEHGADHVDALQPLDVARLHLAAVAQHGHALAEREDLIEEMGDEDHADAARGQLAHGGEQRLHLAGVEAGGRLVEHEHLARQIDRAGDGDDLLHGDRIVAERGAHVDVEAVVGEQRAGERIGPRRATEAQPGRLAAEIEVFRHRQVRQQVHLLIDRADAEPLGIGGIGRIDRRAVEPDLAGITRQDAGHHLDQGRLPGAVLAEEGMYLAGAQVEIDRIERPHAGKRLGQPSDLEDGLGACHHPDLTVLLTRVRIGRGRRGTGRAKRRHRAVRPGGTAISPARHCA